MKTASGTNPEATRRRRKSSKLRGGIEKLEERELPPLLRLLPSPSRISLREKGAAGGG